jgi:iron/zinc/copper transport system substrate-binding protein
MLKRLSMTIVALALTVWGVVAFTQRTPETVDGSASGKLRVVTTNSILEDMVAQVGGDRIELYSIVKRGVDPHEYDPQPRDITATGQADLIFHNGLNLETGGSGWFKKLIYSAHKTWGDDVVAASTGVTPLHLSTNKNEQDPHAWLSLANGAQYVRTITKALVRKDPANAAYYERRSADYIEKLTRLHERTQQQFAAVPKNARVLVTSEGAFKYFGKAYAVTPVYIWELNTEAQGTPEQMQTVLRKIRSSDVQALFVETSVSPKSMEKVSHETSLPIKAKIFTDSLAPRGQTGDTYYAMMQWNIKQMLAGMKIK